MSLVPIMGGLILTSYTELSFQVVGFVAALFNNIIDWYVVCVYIAVFPVHYSIYSENIIYDLKFHPKFTTFSSMATQVTLGSWHQIYLTPADT